MSAIDIADLRKKALAVNHALLIGAPAHAADVFLTDADEEFHSTATPAAILELLADRDALIEAAEDHRQTAGRAFAERDAAEATLAAVRVWATKNYDPQAHEGADTSQLLELLDSRVDQGPAEPSIYELPDDDLPGMWSRSDFMGGQDEAEEYARKIDAAARVIAGLSEHLWEHAKTDAMSDSQSLALVRYYRERARAVIEAVKA